MRAPRLLLLLTCAVLLVLSACDTEVDPILGEDRPFSLYGYLTPAADTQAVRVFPITGELSTVIQAEIDAVVVSEDLTTGERITWTDSLTTLPDGEIRHVFYAPFRAAYDHTYRLTVTRSDGAQASATVRVPPQVTFTIEPANVTRFDIDVPLQLDAAPSFALSAYAQYETSTLPLVTMCDTPDPTFHKVRLPYDVDVGRQRGWRFIVDLKDDFGEVTRSFRDNNIRPNDRIFLQRIRFVVNVTNAEWEPPGGAFDIDALVEPGVFSNVENGFGFLGAGYPAEAVWRPAVDVLDAVGFFESRPIGPCQR
ncbi:MAG: hypothetical protein AAGJ10_12215 [Bacteroidota bacterium]